MKVYPSPQELSDFLASHTCKEGQKFYRMSGKTMRKILAKGGFEPPSPYRKIPGRERKKPPGRSITAVDPQAAIAFMESHPEMAFTKIFAALHTSPDMLRTILRAASRYDLIDRRPLRGDPSDRHVKEYQGRFGTALRGKNNIPFRESDLTCANYDWCLKMHTFVFQFADNEFDCTGCQHKVKPAGRVDALETTGAQEQAHRVIW
jgi:hypothetical protein